MARERMDQHNPVAAPNPDLRYDLCCKSATTDEMVWLSTKPLTYAEGQEYGRMLNELREKIGFGYKVTMELREEEEPS